MSEKAASGIETLKDDFLNCRVFTPDGLFCQVEVRARVPLPPREVYNILTAEDNRKIFKSIKCVNARHVLADFKGSLGHDRQLVEVDQTGMFKLLFYRGEFSVHTLVDQDADVGVMQFWKPSSSGGFMKEFAGEWRVLPWTNESFQELNRDLDPQKGSPLNFPLKPETERLAALRAQLEKQGTSWETVTQPPEGGLPSLRAQVQGHSAAGSPRPDGAISGLGLGQDVSVQGADTELHTLVTLRQVVQPGIVPPGPLKHLVRKICGATIAKIVRDLQRHARDLNAQRRAEASRAMLSHQLSDLDIASEEEDEAVGASDAAQTQAQAQVSAPVARAANASDNASEASEDREGSPTATTTLRWGADDLAAMDPVAVESAAAELLKMVEAAEAGAQAGAGYMYSGGAGGMEEGDRVEGGLVAVAASPRNGR